MFTENIYDKGTSYRKLCSIDGMVYPDSTRLVSYTYCIFPMKSSLSVYSLSLKMSAGITSESTINTPIHQSFVYFCY